MKDLTVRYDAKKMIRGGVLNLNTCVNTRKYKFVNANAYP